MVMENSVLNRNIRRMEDELAISGLAVLALGAWSSIKLCVRIFLGYG